jgi:hypothetical protein
MEVSGQFHVSAALLPGKEPLVPTGREAGWAPEPVWTLWKKVKLSLCFNWSPHHEGVLGEWRYSSTHSLNSALEEGEWWASRPGRFTPKERIPCTQWIGGWMGPRAVLDAVKRKISSPRRESNPRTPIIQPIAQRYTDGAIPAPSCSPNSKYIFEKVYNFCQGNLFVGCKTSIRRLHEVCI